MVKYIYKNKKGLYEIRKWLGGRLLYWGSFKTLEEAKLYLAYYIGKKWRVNPHFRNRESRYIVEQNGSFLVRKRQNGRLVCFGTFNNFDDAKTERDVCEACNWDMDCIVEFGDTIQDKGCVVYG